MSVQICPREIGDPQEEAKLITTCPHDDRTTCQTGQQCETCQIFWDTKAVDKTCPHDDRTTCQTGQQCETCQIFWNTKEGK